MRIRTSRSFNKRYSRLNPKVKQQFKKRLNLFIASPFDAQLRNHPMKGAYKNYRSIDITGDFRALYSVEDGVIIFNFIGTHSQLY